MGGASTTASSPKRHYWSKDENAIKRSAASYAEEEGRIYRPPQVGLRPPVGMNIHTNSKIPVTLMLDDTGSMSKMPGFLLERTPTMYNEMNAGFLGYTVDELAEKSPVEVPFEMELSIVAFGDAKYDQYPLQVLDFKKHDELVRDICKIYPEGGGGANLEESYELAAYFLLNHCETPKSVIKPLCIIFGDETFYDRVDKYQMKRLIGDDLERDLNSYDVMRQLQEKFDTYVLRPELFYSAEQYKNIDKKWREVFPKDRVRRMPDPEAIVNVMILIAGEVSDHFQEALGYLKRREEQWEIDQALETVHPMLKKKR